MDHNDLIALYLNARYDHPVASPHEIAVIMGRHLDREQTLVLASQPLVLEPDGVQTTESMVHRALLEVVQMFETRSDERHAS